MKEVMFSINTDEHDLNTKLRKVEAFLAKGLFVKITVLSKRVQQPHAPSVPEQMQRLIGLLKAHGSPDGGFRVEGRNQAVILRPSAAKPPPPTKEPELAK